LAKITQKYNVDFITLSTDYVFDGEKTGGYYPSDETNPINIYGLSKYLGEKFAQDINPNSIIIRTSWLYGGNMNTKNFVNTMIKLSQNKPELRVISDQFGTPTYTIDLSTAIASIIPKLEQYR
jgi:dTDP-4-dehydrorhamnose reductase